MNTRPIALPLTCLALAGYGYGCTDANDPVSVDGGSLAADSGRTATDSGSGDLSDSGPVDAGAPSVTAGEAALLALDRLVTSVCSCDESPNDCEERIDDFPHSLPMEERMCVGSVLDEYDGVECWARAFEAAAECAERTECAARQDPAATLSACLPRTNLRCGVVEEPPFETEEFGQRVEGRCLSLPDGGMPDSGMRGVEDAGVKTQPGDAGADPSDP